MRRLIGIVTILALVVVVSSPAHGANGSSLISIGPISRSMGGVGIAAPQDVVTALSANPAGMNFGPYCTGSQVDVDVTVVTPTPKAEIERQGVVTRSNSNRNVFPIPAFGLSVPITSEYPSWR